MSFPQIIDIEILIWNPFPFSKQREANEKTTQTNSKWSQFYKGQELPWLREYYILDNEVMSTPALGKESFRHIHPLKFTVN